MKQNALIISVLLLAAVGGGTYLYFKNKDKEESKNSDKATIDISDPSTRQAMELFNMLGVSSTGGWGLKYFHDIPEERLLNLMLTITDWPKVQEKFRGMCNNEYSLSKALSDGLTADEYQRAIRYAGAKKVVTTTSAQATIMKGSIAQMPTFQKNTILGAYTNTANGQYGFINEIDDDGNEVKGSILTTQAKLM